MSVINKLKLPEHYKCLKCPKCGKHTHCIVSLPKDFNDLILMVQYESIDHQPVPTGKNKNEIPCSTCGYVINTDEEFSINED